MVPANQAQSSVCCFDDRKRPKSFWAPTDFAISSLGDASLR